MFIERMKAYEVVTQTELGTGRDRESIVVFLEKGLFLFQDRVYRNWPSQERVEFENGTVLNWSKKTVGGVPVRVYLASESVILAARKDREVRKLVYELEGLKPADFRAAIQLLSEAGNVKLHHFLAATHHTLLQLQEVLYEMDLAIVKSLRAALTVVRPLPVAPTPPPPPTCDGGGSNSMPLAA